MKATKETQTIMAGKFKTFIEYFLDDKKTDISLFDTKSGFYFERDLHRYWQAIFNSVNFPDDNPNVLRYNNGARLFKRNESFNVYPGNTNDGSLTTLLKKAYQSAYNAIRLERNLNF